MSIAKRAIEAVRREWLAVRTIAVTLDSALTQIGELAVSQRSERAQRLVTWADHATSLHAERVSDRVRRAQELVLAGDDASLAVELSELLDRLQIDTGRARAARQRAAVSADAHTSRHNGSGSG